MQSFFAGMCVLIGLLVAYLFIFVLGKPNLDPARASTEL